MSGAFFAGLLVGVILTFVCATAALALFDYRDTMRREAARAERARTKYGNSRVSV